MRCKNFQGCLVVEYLSVTPQANHQAMRSRSGAVILWCFFIPVEVWGTVSPETGKIQVHQELQVGDEDLLDLAALHTLFNSGVVFVVLPEEPLAAVFRY